jgi:hypothetical protein
MKLTKTKDQKQKKKTKKEIDIDTISTEFIICSIKKI